MNEDGECTLSSEGIDNDDMIVVGVLGPEFIDEMNTVSCVVMAYVYEPQSNFEVTMTDGQGNDVRFEVVTDFEDEDFDDDFEDDFEDEEESVYVPPE